MKNKTVVHPKDTSELLNFLYKEKGLDPVTTLPRLGMDSGDGSLKAIFNLVDLRPKKNEDDEEEEEDEEEIESDDEDESEVEEDDDTEEEEEDEEEEWEEVEEEEVEGGDPEEKDGPRDEVELEKGQSEDEVKNKWDREWQPASTAFSKAKPRSKKRKLNKSLKAFFKDSG